MYWYVLPPHSVPRVLLIFRADHRFYCPCTFFVLLFRTPLGLAAIYNDLDRLLLKGTPILLLLLLILHLLLSRRAIRPSPTSTDIFPGHSIDKTGCKFEARHTEDDDDDDGCARTRTHALAHADSSMHSLAVAATRARSLALAVRVRALHCFTQTVARASPTRPRLKRGGSKEDEAIIFFSV